VLGDELRALVRLAGAVAGADEGVMRLAITDAARHVRPHWAEEVILQSYLFAGFPRALNAAREWRRASGRTAPVADADESYDAHSSWRARGEATCATVYGRFYTSLRRNIRELHPALDAWMIVEGYGKVLSRPQLDLRRRELCVVSACATARQPRQLHSHLHGALHAGSTVEELRAVIDALTGLLSADDRSSALHLIGKVATANVR
jgi:4-carboxymuconolactone decarboxylase